jgi:hypothetical protein
MHDKNAIKLLEKYGERIIAGQKPNPGDYLDSYSGSDKQNFKIELNLVTLLAIDGILYRQKLEEDSDRANIEL